MKLNLKFKITKNKLKISNDKNGYLIENITSKPSYVVFLQPIYVKNKFITIKNYIDKFNWENIADDYKMIYDSIMVKKWKIKF